MKKEGAWRTTVFLNFGDNNQYSRSYLYDDEEKFKRQMKIKIKQDSQYSHIVQILGETFDGNAWVKVGSWCPGE